MSSPESIAHLPSGPFSGVQVFAQMVRDALATAARDGWSTMVWSDPNFLDWPLRERGVIESLDGWVRSGRRLILLAAQYDDIRRHHPRFVTWRGIWDHRLDCRISRGIGGEEVPSALWSPQWSMQRLDVVRCSGIASSDAQRRASVKEMLDEFLRQSGPGFSVTTLGL